MKKAYFYIDDIIWVFRDITRQKPKKLFDNPFLGMLKNAHDKYISLARYLESHGIEADMYPQGSFALGTAVAYGVSALGVALFDWRFAFVVFAILLLISLGVFCIVVYRAKQHFGTAYQDTISNSIDEQALQEPVSRKRLVTILAFILVADLLVCSLYYGTINWVPNLLKEVHGVDQTYSLLITILVPISTLPGPVIANFGTEKTGKAYFISSIFFAVCTVCMLTMIFLYEANIIIALVCSLISLFFNRGIFNLLSGYLPFKLNRVISASKSAMMINAIACVGAAAIPFITGLIIDKLGWTAYYICMFALAAVTTVMFILGTKYSKKLLP